MTYKIFISYVSEDVLVAETVKQEINNAFGGNIKPYLAAHDLGPGKNWKDELKRNLNECSALISIISRVALNRPWILIEWSAFWINDRTYYTLLSDDVQVSDLFELIRDVQAVRMSDLSDVRRFFKSLAEAAERTEIPYAEAEGFVERVQLAQRKQALQIKERSFERYRVMPRALPSDDREKRAIAEYYLEKGEVEIFEEIVEEIRDINVKTAIALELIDKGDLERVLLVTEHINSMEHVGEVAIELIERAFLDAPQIRQILESMAEKNQRELSKVVERMLELGHEDTLLFDYILELLTNAAERRKLATSFIRNGNTDAPLFQELVDGLSTVNNAELRKVAMEFLYTNTQTVPGFDRTFRALARGNQRIAARVLEALEEVDPELYKMYLKEGLTASTKAVESVNETPDELG